MKLMWSEGEGENFRQVKTGGREYGKLIEVWLVGEVLRDENTEPH